MYIILLCIREMDEHTCYILSLRSTFLQTVNMTSKNIGEFYQFNLSSCIRQQNSLTAQFVSFSLANLANIFYPPRFLQ